MLLLKQVKRQRMSLRLIVILLIITLISAGCAGMSPRTKAALYCGAGGAIIGALLGALIDKNRARGAAIGAGTGAALGAGACFVIASYTNKEVADYQRTKQQIKYQPSSGNVVRITEFSLTPKVVRPSESLAFSAQYYVMTPNPDKDITVIETRTIRVYDKESATYKELGQSTDQIIMKPGTRRGDGTINLHNSTPEGQYVIALKVGLNGNRAEREYPLTVAAGAPIYQAQEGNKGVTGESPTGKYFVVSANKANLRSGPGTNFQVLNEISKGERYPILETVQNQGGSWYRIRLEDGREGWISGKVGYAE